MNFDTDIQNPCKSCHGSHARHDGLCVTCADEIARPYACHGCAGTGRIAMIRVGTRVARPERACSLCEGRGRISQDAAMDELCSWILATLKTLKVGREPEIVRQARAIGDARVFGAWDRTVTLVVRESKMLEVALEMSEVG